MVFLRYSMCDAVCVCAHVDPLEDTMTVVAKGIDISSKFQVAIICCVSSVCER